MHEIAACGASREMPIRRRGPAGYAAPMWLACALMFVAGGLWSYAHGYGAAALMSGWLAAGSFVFFLKPGLFTRLLDETSR